MDQNVDAEVMDEVFEVEVSAVLDAEHDAFVPPPVPAHDHVHGPLPDTVLAVPAVQRLLVGALATVVPFTEPQVPLTALEVFAWQVKLAPFVAALTLVHPLVGSATLLWTHQLYVLPAWTGYVIELAVTLSWWHVVGLAHE